MNTDDTQTETPYLDPVPKPQFWRRYRAFMRFVVRHFGVNPLSFVFNTLLGLGIVTFGLFLSPVMRDNVIKTHILPMLEQFNIPKISYNSLSINAHHSLIGTDIVLYDKTKQKCVAINTITIDPVDFFDISQGFKNINIDTITVFKSPILSVSDNSNKNTPLEIPIIPFDIQNLIINHLTLKPALTKSPKDINLKITASNTLQTALIGLNITALDYKNARLKTDITHKNNIITLNSTITSPADFINTLLDNGYFKDTLTATINATIDMDKYFKNPNHAIDIHAKKISITDSKLKLGGTFKTALSPAPFALNNTNIHLESGDNSLDFRGDITEKYINGRFQANQFNLVDFYPVIDGLQKLTLNGDLKINGAFRTIPNINGTMSVGAVYQNTPLNADIIGKHTRNKTAIDFKLKNAEKFIADASIVMNDQQQGNADIIINPINIPEIFQKDIPVAINDITITTDFKRKNNTLVLSNGHLELKSLKTKNNITPIPTAIQDLKLNFSNTPDALKIDNAAFTGIINKHIYDMAFDGTFYEYYKPKTLVLQMANRNNKVENITLNINHRKTLDDIDLNMRHVNFDALFGKQIPIKVTDFNTAFRGKANIFSDNILGTISGNFTSNATHTPFGDTKASIALNGTITAGTGNADYKLMMNDTQAGTGTVKINDRLTTLSTTTDTDLQALNIFIHNTHHRITGTMIANINLDNGIISGDVAVKNGTYRNLLHGTMIDTINMQSTITPDFINVLELTAKSQPIGTLNAKGIISVSPTTESNFIMTMSELTPLKNTMLSLNADSTLNLVGNSNNLKLTGQIKLNDLLILLPDLKANNTPKLTIIRPSDVPTTPTETESIPLAERVQTDIAVSITEGAKIVGFGLQGFPYGTLQIRGTLGTPKIDGQIDIARGKIDFFGKNFKIINGGIAIKQTNPIFNIQATHTIDKKIINLSLKGTVQSPDIVLSSTPQIPKDEIIALLVFGRNKNELSPFQALQLANTVYQLSRGKSGAGSTFDIIGKTERLLNIDELNINSGDNNSVNIGAGKYISEDIYVATEYNPTTASSLFRLEFKLSDSVDLITRLNTSNTINNTNNSELMLIKNKDY